MQGTFYLIQSNSSLQKTLLFGYKTFMILLVFMILFNNNINFILKHSAPFISWESMYALCRVRVQYPLINISEQFVQVSVRLSNKYWIWWSWAKFAEIFLFLWIIHALFWLASLNFCEWNLINCINAYIHIWKQLLVFITSKTCSFSYLQKLKRLAFSIIMVDLEL